MVHDILVHAICHVYIIICGNNVLVVPNIGKESIAVFCVLINVL